MDMDCYFRALRGKRTAVLGVGISNLPLAQKLLEYGAVVTLHDRKEVLKGKALELSRQAFAVCLGAGYLDEIDADVIFRSPGIRPDEAGILRAVAGGAVLTSEMEAFFEVCPCPITAVTGSDGKTTTTTLIALMLERQGKRVHLGGNIGMPLLCKAGNMSPDDEAVVELSSFQLMTMSVPAHRAVITNLAPNHLDKHRSMEEYVDSKMNIFRGQGPDDLLVLNADNRITAPMAAQAGGRVRMFSRAAPVEEGCYLDGDSVMFSSGGNAREIFKRKDILLRGDHNTENYMAAAACLMGQVEPETMAEVARTFKGVAHRMELIRTLNGVEFYNDSIASSPTRTAAGLSCFGDNVVLIAGGYDKKIPFDPLGPDICAHVKQLFLYGPTASAIAGAVERAPGSEKPKIVMCGNFDEAVLEAAHGALSGQCVLMSPACASFDSFNNFEERGERFRQLVNGL